MWGVGSPAWFSSQDVWESPGAVRLLLHRVPGQGGQSAVSLPCSTASHGWDCGSVVGWSSLMFTGSVRG